MSLAVVSAVLLGADTAIQEEDVFRDNLDDFNHPRRRRISILNELTVGKNNIHYVPVSTRADSLDFYRGVHSPELLEFLISAWKKWTKLGPQGQDPIACLTQTKHPPLIPSHTPLPRQKQRPSQHVIGQISYYCTDTCTPIFNGLVDELLSDAALCETALQLLNENNIVYVLPIHPGHHAAADSFGGYCYVNHAASLARQWQSSHNHQRVAILDVDYHAGNGTTSIFDQDPTVLVVSLHCDPNCEYPFHSGFADENHETTLNLPLPPGTTWKDDYRSHLHQALEAIHAFDAGLLIISLGLDALEGDPCAIRRAGFRLQMDDFRQMGMAIRQEITLPMLVTQEGGYRMDWVGSAAAAFTQALAGDEV